MILNNLNSYNFAGKMQLKTPARKRNLQERDDIIFRNRRTEKQNLRTEPVLAGEVVPGP